MSFAVVWLHILQCLLIMASWCKLVQHSGWAFQEWTVLLPTKVMRAGRMNCACLLSSDTLFRCRNLFLSTSASLDETLISSGIEAPRSVTSALKTSLLFCHKARWFQFWVHFNLKHKSIPKDYWRFLVCMIRFGVYCERWLFLSSEVSPRWSWSQQISSRTESQREEIGSQNTRVPEPGFN